MSFLNIKDKRKRDKTIKDYLALKKQLQRRYMEERTNFIDHQRDLEEQLLLVMSGWSTPLQSNLYQLKIKCIKLLLLLINHYQDRK